jgi:hypothetical protein
VLLTRKRIACETYLDMRVGLTLRQEPGTGTPVIGELRFGETRPGPQEGWLVALGITNPGRMPVRGSDFSAPLTFTFPGREIRATWISPEPAGTAASRARQLPSARVPAAGGHAACLEIGGDFLLRPGGSYSVTVILSGIPAASYSHIRQEGSLTNGKITTTPGAEPGS